MPPRSADPMDAPAGRTRLVSSGMGTPIPSAGPPKVDSSGIPTVATTFSATCVRYA